MPMKRVFNTRATKAKASVQGKGYNGGCLHPEHFYIPGLQMTEARIGRLSAASWSCREAIRKTFFSFLFLALGPVTARDRLGP